MHAAAGADPLISPSQDDSSATFNRMRRCRWPRLRACPGRWPSGSSAPGPWGSGQPITEADRRSGFINITLRASAHRGCWACWTRPILVSPLPRTSGRWLLTCAASIWRSRCTSVTCGSIIGDCVARVERVGTEWFGRTTWAMGAADRDGDGQVDADAGGARTSTGWTLTRSEDLQGRSGRLRDGRTGLGRIGGGRTPRRWRNSRRRSRARGQLGLGQGHAH